MENLLIIMMVVFSAGWLGFHRLFHSAKNRFPLRLPKNKTLSGKIFSIGFALTSIFLFSGESFAQSDQHNYAWGLDDASSLQMKARPSTTGNDLPVSIKVGAGAGSDFDPVLRLQIRTPDEIAPGDTISLFFTDCTAQPDLQACAGRAQGTFGGDPTIVWIPVDRQTEAFPSNLFRMRESANAGIVSGAIVPTNIFLTQHAPVPGIYVEDDATVSAIALTSGGPYHDFSFEYYGAAPASLKTYIFGFAQNGVLANFVGMHDGTGAILTLIPGNWIGSALVNQGVAITSGTTATVNHIFTDDADQDSTTTFEYSTAETGAVWTTPAGCGSVGGGYDAMTLGDGSSAHFRTCSITGLTADTVYFVRITHTDPDGVAGNTPAIFGPFITNTGRGAGKVTGLTVDAGDTIVLPEDISEIERNDATSTPAPGAVAADGQYSVDKDEILWLDAFDTGAIPSTATVNGVSVDFEWGLDRNDTSETLYRANPGLEPGTCGDANWTSILGPTAATVDVWNTNSVDISGAGYTLAQLGTMDVCMDRTGSGNFVNSFDYLYLNVVYTPAGSSTSAATNPATFVTDTSAQLNGRLHNAGIAGQVQFEYGLTAAYGSTTPLFDTMNKNAEQPYWDTISSLSAGTLYHFRLCLTTTLDGTVCGADQTFTTLTPATTLGDGTTPADKFVSPSSTNNAVNAFTLSTNTGADTLTALTVDFSGTGDPGDIETNGVKIWRDDGTVPNEWDASDTQIGTGQTMGFFPQEANFTGLSEPITTTVVQYLVTYDIDNAPTDGATLLANVSAATVTNPLTNNDNVDATLTVQLVACGSPVTIRPNGISATGGWGDGGFGPITAGDINDQSDFSWGETSDGDTTFTATIANSGCYTGNQIDSVTIWVRAAMPGGGNDELDWGPTGFSSGVPVTAAAGATDYSKVWATNPATALAWTPAEVDALAVDVDFLQSGGHNENRVYEVWVEVAYTVLTTTTVGDGTPPANKSVNLGSTNNAVSAFTLTTDSGVDTVTGLVVTLNGTGVDADIAANGVKIYQDDGTTANEWDASDTLEGAGVSMSGGTATFSGLSIGVTTTSVQYLVTYDISGSATGGNLLQGAITGVTASNPVVNNDNNDATLSINSTPTTSLGNGTNPASSTVAPGSGITDLDAFTFQTNSGTDTITDLTVTLAAGTAAGLSEVRVTSDDGATLYYAADTTPTDVMVFSGGTNITATTTLTQYKIRITPKTHAAMPAPPGSSYAVTGTVTAWTGTLAKAGSDSGSATITVDNLSPGEVSGASGTPGDGQVDLTWTDPGDGDLDTIVILRRAGAAVGDTPVEGTTYIVGNTIGSSTVACVIAAGVQACSDSGVTNGTAYHYKIFAKDTRVNYSTPGVVPTGSPFTPDVTTTIGDGTAPSDKTVAQSSTDNAVNAFTLSTSSGGDTLTSLTVTFTGTNVADVAANGVKLYRDENSDSEWDAGDTQIGAAVSFSGATATIGSLSEGITTTPVNYIITYDIDAAATPADTLQGAVTAASVTNNLVNNDNVDATLTIGALVVDDGRIVYGESTPAATMPNTRLFDDSGGSPAFSGTEDDTVSGTAPVVVRNRANSFRDEHIAGYVNSAGTLQIMRYDGATTTWTNEWSTAVGGNGTTGRRFDIAFEENTGRGIVVYSRNVSGANEMGYRIWDGLTWTGEALIDPIRISGTVLWVKLEARPNANDMGLIFSDSNNDLSGLTWDGTTWGNEPGAAFSTNLENAFTIGGTEAFDLTFEMQSGELMVAWGDAGTGGFNYSVFNGVSWAGGFVDMADNATYLDMSSDPSSDRIVLAQMANNRDDLAAAVWNGAAWTASQNVNTGPNTPVANQKFLATGWMVVPGPTSRAVIVYGGGTTSVNWATWNGTFTGSDFTVQTDWAPTPAFSFLGERWIEIVMDPINPDQLMVTLSDGANDLWAKRLVMSAGPTYNWFNEESGAATLEANLNSVAAQNFSFDYDRVITKVIVGDGVSPASKSAVTGSSSNAASSFTLSTNTGADTVTEIQVDFTGTAAADVPANGVKLFLDNGSVPNEWDATDTQIGTGQSLVANVATFNSGAGFPIAVSTSPVQYLITYDIDGAATATNTLQASIRSVSATGPTINNDNLDATLTVVDTPSTTLGDGVNPASATVAPGSGITDLDSFTFQTNIGTDTITDLTVTLAAGTAAGLAEVRITSDNGATLYYTAVSNPGSDTIVFSGGTAIVPTTTQTQYKVRITPKTHAAMPAPAGSFYAVTGTVTAWTGGLLQQGSDAASATINVDNLSPGNVSGASATAGPSKVDLAWTDPVDGDLGTILILRATAGVISDVPVEGTTYIVGNTIGSSTVACVIAAGVQACSDTGVTDGTPYHYKLFAQDTRGNYSTPGVVPPESPVTPNTYTTLGNGTNPATVTVAPGSGIIDLDSFTFQTNAGTDTITDLTVTLAAGTAAGLSEVRITNDGGGTTYYTAVSNPGSDTIVFSGGTNITATTTLTQYKVRITPKSHAAMPAPAGSEYAVTGTVTAWTGTNAQQGSDSGSATITVDNLSPGNVTGATAAAGDTEVVLAWTEPGDADRHSVIVLQRAGAAVGDTPVEGTVYSVSDTIGSSTVVCVEATVSTGCTSSGLTNGTAYHYKVFVRDTNGNYSASGVVPTGSPATPAATTSIANGTDPGNVTIAPGGPITDLDSFTFATSTGVDSITQLEVTLAAGTAASLSEVRITNDGGGTTYFNAVSNPGSDVISFTGGTPIPVTTSATQFKIRITPKSHAALPAPPGSEIDVTGTVTDWTGSNTNHLGSDSGSATVKIDNLSPANVSPSNATPGDQQVVLTWTEPGDADRAGVVVLRRAGSAVADVPVEGTTYVVGNTIGTATVACVVASISTGCTDDDGGSLLTNGTAYHYEIFVRDTNGNYSTGTVPTGSPATPNPVTVVGDFLGTAAADKNVVFGDVDKAVNAFTLRTTSGADSVTEIVVTFSGTDVNDVPANGVKIYLDGGGTPGEWDAGDTQIGNGESFAGGIATFNSGVGFPIAVSTTETRYIITYDIDASAGTLDTLQGVVSSVTVTNILDNQDLADATLTVGVLTDDNGRLVYGESTPVSTMPNARVFSDPLFSAAEEDTVSGTAPVVMVDRAANKRDEHLAGYVDASGTLEVLRYINPGGWFSGVSTSVGGNGTNGRRFDIAYEGGSGDALLVASNGVPTTNELAYGFWDGTSWTGPINLDPTTIDGTVLWVKLAASPTSNRIALIFSDSNNNLSAMVWNGTSFVNETNLAAANLQVVGSPGDIDPFDVAVEKASGDILVAWAPSGATDINYATFSGGSWSAPAAVGTGTTTFRSLDLSSDPLTDRILLAGIGTGGALGRGVWNGTAWVAVGNNAVAAQVPIAGEHLVSNGWLNSGGTKRGVVVFRDSADDDVHYLTYNPGTMTFSAENAWTPSSVLGSIKQLEVDVDLLRRDRLMLTYSDTQLDLWAKHLLLTPSATFTWTDVEDSGVALEDNLNTIAAQNFSFAFDRFAPFILPPTGFTAVTDFFNPETQINLSWTDNAASELGYLVQSALSDGTCDGVGEAYTSISAANLPVPGGNPISWLKYSGAPSETGATVNAANTNLTPATAYCYRAQADASGGDSDWTYAGPTTTAGAAADVTPPSAVSDLGTVSPMINNITLVWTAPGDDGTVGTATSYDIRYSTGGGCPLLEAGWAAATQASGEPAPKLAGAIEGFTVTGLSASTTYCFAIKTSDEVPNESTISNSASGTTLGPDVGTPSAAVISIVAGSQRPQSMELAWTAVGDDAGVGTATLYDLRFSLTTIGDPAGAGEVDWSTVCTNTTLSTLNATRPNDCVVPVVNLSAPVPAGNAESRIVSGRINPSASPAFACDVNDVDISHTPCLVPNQAYYFALKVEDEVPNVSSMSNVVGGSNRTDGTATNAGLTALRNGFNLVSVPWALTTNTPTAVFGDDPVGSLSLFEWLSTGPATTDGCYSAYPIGSSTCIPGDEITLVVTGTGYFMNGGGGNDVVDAPADSAAVATGTNCGIANSYQVAVVEGWNIVGSPFEKPVDLDAVYVCAAGVARIFDDLDADATNDAASLGWVNFAMFRFNGSVYLPLTISGTPQAPYPARFEAWNSYWVNVTDATVTHMVFPQPP